MALLNASNFNIEGDANNTIGRDQHVWNVNLSDSSTDKAFRILAEKAAKNACYDSEQRSPPPNCHPGTRRTILNKLSSWIDDNSKTTRVFWLYGSAGVGKSAIAQNLAEKYAGGRIAAAFFFSRNDPTRDKLDSFVASIAYQFCAPDSPLGPVLRPSIIEAIRSDPNIFWKVFENQFEKLLIEPCSRVDTTKWDGLPNVIAIDGLDECIDHASQERLLRLIRKLVHTRGYPIPWTFLIFSRPELQIQDAFSHKDFSLILECFAIRPSKEVNRDIRRCLVDRFAELRGKLRALRHEDESWPGEDATEQLVKRADGQFIFVNTVIKYIDTRDNLPQDRLNAVLDIHVVVGSNSPYSELDLLYQHIMSTCLEKWEKVQPVLRLLVTPYPDDLDDLDRGINMRSPAMIERLLTLKTGEVAILLSTLHSVLEIPEDDKSGIHIMHASFSEFLSDVNRSANYHCPPLPEPEYCDYVATLLLRTLSPLRLHYSFSHPQSTFTTSLSEWRDIICSYKSNLLEYALECWPRYCTKIDLPSPGLLVELSKFDPCSVVSACVSYKIWPFLVYWGEAIDWAKRFGQSMEGFAKTCESFIQLGFSIAFPPGVPRHEALWFTFEMENDSQDAYYIQGFRGTMLRKLYSFHTEVYQGKHEVWTTDNAVVLPIDAHSHITLPDDWIVVHVTEINGKVFRRVVDALEDDKVGQKLLLDDIREDSCETVSRKLVSKDDLKYLERLLKERRELLFPECDNWPDDRSYYSSSDSSSECSSSDSDESYHTCYESSFEYPEASDIPD